MVFEVHGKVYNWAWFCQQLVFCVFSHLCCRCHDIVKLFSLSSFYPQVVISFSVSSLNSRVLKYLHVNPLKSYMYISEVFARELHLIGGIQIFIDIVFYSDFVFKIVSLSFYWQINRFEPLIAVWEATKYVYLTFQHRFASQPLNLLYYGIVWSHFTPINLTFGCFFFKLFITHLIYFVMALEFYRF